MSILDSTDCRLSRIGGHSASVEMCLSFLTPLAFGICTRMRDYIDAHDKSIIRPQKAKVGRNFDEWVTSSSPFWQRKCFVQIRRYQSIECQDHSRMDVADECWKHAEIFSLTDNFFDETRNENRQWLIGAVCFSKYPDITMLDFCWIHPFWRNRGLLKKSWPTFYEKFGDFLVSEPRSQAMQCFLKSIGHTDRQG